MQSLWNDEEARECGDDALKLRIYTSHLLGRNPDLVLHGGGNTSVKITEPNFFGEPQEVLYVKGSGRDLATIDATGFAPVRISVLHQLAKLDAIDDRTMMREMRAGLVNPAAPDPSVESILHAAIPARYVDHSHADAVVAVTNTPDGEKHVREIFGERVLIVPYVMPGFTLSKAIAERLRGGGLSRIEGIVLLNHGLFTFGDDARTSYERMIRLVTAAEDFLARRAPRRSASLPAPRQGLEVKLAQLRKAVSSAAGQALIARLNASPEHAEFSARPDAPDLVTRGCLTPDHIIRTKRIAAIVRDDSIPAAVQRYADEYRVYFARHVRGRLTMLDPAPRWALWQETGTVAFGETEALAQVAADIVAHTLHAIDVANSLGGWHPLSEADSFRMEYWVLEQAKLQRTRERPPFAGKIALITGAGSGIGKACAELLHEQGAAVVSLDRNPAPAGRRPPAFHDLVVDVTDSAALENAVKETVRRFGGLDIVVCNAGIFPPSMRIEEMQPAPWDESLAVNLTAHQRLMQYSIPYLRHGIDPTLIIIGSKNVPAPGPGAAAYSAAKAALTQLARVAALELAADGIRVNTIHPDAVFDTALWTPENLEKRAKSYGLSVEDYKTKNLLHAEITSRDVARMVCALAGPAFRCTTGAQIPLDGGNDRVI
jgi:rhamnose utilization protein RhaD (predicted bifunctional aldolase and dehydrogenase)/NAD(P)-dependent dehydrogenase (short-subunit alcohol dehydrogenase family)